jgi:deoxycytidine triphosphate deaminase
LILCDRDIAEYIRLYKMVVGAEPDQINPASMDVRLGRYIKIETPEGWESVDLVENGSYWLRPKEFVLAHTVELFNLPDGRGECKQAISARFALKSSAGRSGLQHLMAAYCDPGWNNSTLTLELLNVRNYHRIELYYGRKIGQMIFETVNTPDRSYAETGRYNNDSIVTESKGW